MKRPIELGKEYPMRGGGVFVIHFIDPLYGYLIGRRQYRNGLEWEAGSCLPNGRIFPDKEDRHDIMFPRIVMVPVKIKETDMNEPRNIVVTLSQPVQTGMDEWTNHHVSRVFSTTRPIKDMLAWAESEGIKEPSINDLHLSEYTGESM